MPIRKTFALSSANIIAALGFTPASAGAVIMSDGTVASPGMAFGTNVDTGFYRVGANILGVSAGGVEQARFGTALVTTGAFSTDISTGYMGLGRTDPGYWIDYNKAYTDFAAGTAEHHFHMYGYAEVSSETALGEMTGYYAHLDGGPSMIAGKTMERLFPLRGNGTWGVAGTLAALRGVYAGARVQNDAAGAHLTGNGVITNAYGGYFEAANETTGIGTITNAHAVYGEVRNTDGGVMTTAYGLYSNIRNQTNGGGITSAYGLRLELESAGAGIATYYGAYFGSTITSGFFNIYTGNSTKSWHRGSFAIGESSTVSGSRVYINENAQSTAATIFRASHASFDNDVVRVTADRASSTAFDLLTCEANSVVLLGVRGDGQMRFTAPPRFNQTNSTGAGSASLGANCPAVTASAPHTWISFVSSDGSSVFIPVWK